MLGFIFFGIEVLGVKFKYGGIYKLGKFNMRIVIFSILEDL